ncbi:hypothetical protein SAMN05216223_106171 [Actinacidiphila yanglinensis]|uniref:Glycosyl hydrolases family 18 n=1 Tax=Actinacidiphila yanglinensis TaxID=310779 RepID=A0A1H6B3A3_9ACTN|nr:hypothetical protein [Actinacidiphila yanglinensis]SEG55090.1 hypothetical protein SAMN05216223_106171 [Actinacidiphila yanglinensis]
MTRRTALRWLRRAAIGGTALAVVAVLGAAGALRAQYAGNPAAAGRTRGHDAVWLGHAWVDGTRTPAELALLRARVRGTGIHDLYVHTGPLSADGSLDPQLYPAAAAFIADVHRELPGIRVQAWLGDTVAHGGTPGLHLDDRAVRERIRDSAQQVLDAGFEGVHLDLEPVLSGDAGYLRTLEAVHELTGDRGVPLSAAAPQIDPLPHLHALSQLAFTHPKWWSQRYFGQVAARVDQIAVMAYDTSMPTESLFGGYVAQQTSLALHVTPATTNLLIGLPGYHTEDMGHHGYAETVGAAVRGARVSLARTARDRRAFGLALYVDFGASTGDWTAYRTGWGTP